MEKMGQRGWSPFSAARTRCLMANEAVRIDVDIQRDVD